MHRGTKDSQQPIQRGNSGSGRPRMMKGHSVSIIGAGRLGTALGLALKAAGYQIEVVVARRPSAARRAGKVFGPKTLALSAFQLGSLALPQEEILNQSSLVLVTTPDDVIEPLAKQLAGIFSRKPIRTQKRAVAPRRVILHTSGALSSAALKPMQAA